jgi:uncharacterized DUF497 family protein
MKFEWDRQKSLSNREKHGVTFEEAVEVIDDPLHLSVVDQRFGHIEERWVTVGRTKGGYCTVVADLYFTEEGEEIVRIVSARRATRRERRQYEIEA